MSTFGGVCFLQLFDWSTPYRCFCWFSSTFHQVSLVPLFTTRGVVEPPENDLIISETSIRSFRQLEHQNPSIIDWVIDSWSGCKISEYQRLSSSVLPSVTNFASTLTVYYSVINGRILMFKVSKQPYQSARHDGIIFRWRHNPLVVKSWTKQP